MQAFIGTLIGNLIISVGVILVILLLKKFRKKLVENMEYMVSLTVGILIGIVFLGFLPEVIDESDIKGFYFGAYILSGILLFYILEIFLHRHHCKDLEHKGCMHKKELENKHLNSRLMFFGTFLHNALHGIILFNLFSISFNIGMAGTFAILLHSIPQNVSNYIMNHDNVKYGYIAAFGGLFGALITYPFIDFLLENRFYIMLIISGTLLYTALTDILPQMKEKFELRHKFTYLLFIVLGILIFSLL